MTFLSSFPSCNQFSQTLIMSSFFPCFNLLIAISVSTSCGCIFPCFNLLIAISVSASCGSAVCMHIVYTSPLSPSRPSSDSKCFSKYSDHLCSTFPLLLTVLPLYLVMFVNPFLILFTS